MESSDMHGRAASLYRSHRVSADGGGEKGDGSPPGRLQ